VAVYAELAEGGRLVRFFKNAQLAGVKNNFSGSRSRGKVHIKKKPPLIRNGSV
jgi:hypothetical protein